MQSKPDPRLYQLMAERVQDYAIFLLDTSGHIISWNAGATNIKQYTEAEVLGRHFSIFYTEVDIARGWPAQELEQATATGRFEDEGWRVRRDGSRFWANVIITALRDDSGQLLAFSKITRDLTGRKHAEESLRRSEERFRLLVEGVQDYAIYMLSPAGIVNSWNGGAHHITGYEADEVIGTHFSRFYGADDSAAGKPWTELAIAREQGRTTDEGYRIRKDGSRFWARVVVTALYDDDGQLYGYAKVTQDLSLRRHSEALEVSARQVHDFIAILAHELRNPLAPIRNAVQLMQRLPAGDPAQEKSRAIIDRQSAQLSRIVNDLLDISRVTRGNLTMERTLLEAATLVQRAVETSRPAIEAGQHQLIVEVAPEPLYVDGDLLRLNQALTNILNNAARYTAAGGVIRMRADREDGPGGTQLRISVSDNGRGIDPTMLEAIFGMFVQGKDMLQRPAAGLGVGLALARTIAELHHGSLEAYSEGLGRGAEFILRLPLRVIPAMQAPEGYARSVASLPRQDLPADTVTAQRALRVLVTDDNQDAADSLADLLRRHGHEVRSAHDGEAALALCEGFRPELVLLDIGMPGLDGLEVARRLRLRKDSPQPYLVAITGLGHQDDQDRSLTAGFDLHLAKPAEEARLLEILASRART